MSRLAHLARPSGAPIRYEKERPGELVHIDGKKLGRIPAGGGWRMLGRSTQTRRASERSRRAGRAGYDYLHAAVDDHSRVAYVEVHADERGETCARFLARAAGFFAEQGVRIEQVMTDNALNYRRSAAFIEAMAELEITHVPIPPYHPRPTARSSGSTEPSARNGPTAASTAPTPSACAPSDAGWSSTIIDGPTPRWEADRR